MKCWTNTSRWVQFRLCFGGRGFESEASSCCWEWVRAAEAELRSEPRYVVYLGGGEGMASASFSGGKKLWVCHRGGSDFHPATRPAVVLSPNRNTHASQSSGVIIVWGQSPAARQWVPCRLFIFLFVLTASSIWCFFYRLNRSQNSINDVKKKKKERKGFDCPHATLCVEKSPKIF